MPTMGESRLCGYVSVGGAVRCTDMCEYELP